jgi:hypothetical protein
MAWLFFFCVQEPILRLTPTSLPPNPPSPAILLCIRWSRQHWSKEKKNAIGKQRRTPTLWLSSDIESFSKKKTLIQYELLLALPGYNSICWLIHLTKYHLFPLIFCLMGHIKCNCSPLIFFFFFTLSEVFRESRKVQSGVRPSFFFVLFLFYFACFVDSLSFFNNNQSVL